MLQLLVSVWSLLHNYWFLLGRCYIIIGFSCGEINNKYWVYFVGAIRKDLCVPVVLCVLFGDSCLDIR